MKSTLKVCCSEKDRWLLLPDCAPRANGDDVAPVIVVECPEVEERPEQFRDALLVFSTEILELMNFVEICTLGAINIHGICLLHGLKNEGRVRVALG
jgi:hypothetical protein